MQVTDFENPKCIYVHKLSFSCRVTLYDKVCIVAGGILFVTVFNHSTAWWAEIMSEDLQSS